MYWHQEFQTYIPSCIEYVAVMWQNVYSFLQENIFSFYSSRESRSSLVLVQLQYMHAFYGNSPESLSEQFVILLVFHRNYPTVENVRQKLKRDERRQLTGAVATTCDLLGGKRSLTFVS